MGKLFALITGGCGLFKNLVGFVFRGEVKLGQRNVAHDGHQQVIEIVGNSACKSGREFKLLSFYKTFLSL